MNNTAQHQDFNALLGSLSATAEAAPASATREGELLLFNGSTGEWGFGSGKDPLPYGTRIIINPFGVKEGFRRWYLAAKTKLPFDVTATSAELAQLGGGGTDAAAAKRLGLQELRKRLPDSAPVDEDGEEQEWDPEGKGWEPVYVVEGLLMPEGIRVVWSGSSGGAKDGFFRLVYDMTSMLRKAGKVIYPVASLEEHKRGEGYYSNNRKKTFYKPWFELVGSVATFEAEQAGEVPQITSGGVVEAEVVETEEAPPAQAPAKPKARRPKK